MRKFERLSSFSASKFFALSLPYTITIMMSQEQFTQLLHVFHNTHRPLVPVKAVHWSGLSELSTAEPESVDKWFLEYETRLRAAGVVEEQWVTKFVECPSVPEHLKSRVRGEQLEVGEGREFTYAKLRVKLLEEFGPLQPTAYYKRKLHHLKCGSATEAKEAMLTLLELHNRAAKDAELGLLSPRELCYCFIDAVPQGLSRHLEANYALVADSPSALEQLFKMAKAKESTESGDTVLVASSRSRSSSVQDTSPSPQPRRSRSRTSNRDDLASAIALLAQQLNNGSAEQEHRFKVPRIQCQGCGGTCTDRTLCPARGKECFRCHRIGHFGSACRNQNLMQGNGGNAAGNQQRNFRRGPFPNNRR